MSINLSAYVSKKRAINTVDHLMSLAAVVHPLTALPQVFVIYSTHNVTGIALWTWFGFMLLGLIFLAYGILHNIKPFIVTQILWFVVDFAIVVGVFIYR